MLVFDQPHPPANGRGRYFVDRGNWTQLDPDQAGGNRNFPFSERDRDTPYRQFRMAGVYFGPATIDLAFDLGSVDSGSLDSVLSFLEARAADERRVRLEFFKNGWFQEIHQNLKSALARIEQISVFRDLPLAYRTVVDRTDLGAMEAAPALLRACCEVWREKPGFSALQEAGLARQVVLMATDQDGCPRFAEIGRDSAISRFFGQAWRRHALGSPVGASLPDRDYDTDTARGVLDAVGSRQPRYDRILASIERPGQDREWAAYHRLQLPLDETLVSVTQLVPPQELGIPFLQTG